MTPPDLRRLLVLEAPLRTADGAGGYSTTWSVLGTLWAEVSPGAAREGGAAAARRMEAALRVIVRGRPQGAPSRPQAGQRFREGSRLYPILAVTEADPLGRFLLCTALEETAL